MIIVSDATPLRYLIEIDEVHILETLFGHVFIPEKVAEELQRPKTPEKVKAWIEARPVWLQVQKADISVFMPQRRLDDGEREAFALALMLGADAVLIDDRQALAEARRLNLQTISLFTILHEFGQKTGSSESLSVRGLYRVATRKSSQFSMSPSIGPELAGWDFRASLDAR